MEKLKELKELVDQIDNLVLASVADLANDTANALMIKQITADFVFKMTKLIKEIESANANN